MSTVWEYGGAGYPFSACDEECIGRMKLALSQMKEASMTETESQAEAYCRMMQAFFDTVLGAGTGNRICQGGEDGCSTAYLSFTEFVSAQLDAIRQVREAAEAGHWNEATPSEKTRAIGQEKEASQQL